MSPNQIVTRGIVLARTNYGEADRIVTMLTPDHGKLRLMAKGVRKSKSKLAGGIELFSVSEISYIQGRGDISTLTSTRLQTHYGNIVKHIDRTMAGYDLIKQINKATEDEPEPEYFVLLEDALKALNEDNIPELLIRAWFVAQLLRLGGHEPNLQTDTAGNKLQADKAYHFSFDDMAFTPHEGGGFDAGKIKFLRLLFSRNHVDTLAKVQGLDVLVPAVQPLVAAAGQTYLRS